MSDERCSEKMSFDSKAEAEKTATVAKHQHGTRLKAYLCKYCSLWHLATKY